jgi:hypothetical protein
LIGDVRTFLLLFCSYCGSQKVTEVIHLEKGEKSGRERHLIGVEEKERDKIRLLADHGQVLLFQVARDSSSAHLRASSNRVCHLS